MSSWVVITNSSSSGVAGPGPAIAARKRGSGGQDERPAAPAERGIELPWLDGIERAKRPQR
ncbi:MAG TPA: hypothetical protein VL242_49115, partial [Sorangium sp.]|nr:hypothetical protein [Sorangium sp.]